jgi:polyvinyl alcohol dehydrogenase (cytochrome)
MPTSASTDRAGCAQSIWQQEKKRGRRRRPSAFAGSMDGGVRAYSAADGKIVWTFDTNKDFETVNGVPAKGGAMDGPGPVVSGGMVYVLSGYVSLIGRPGNVLLAFGVD